MQHGRWRTWVGAGLASASLLVPMVLLAPAVVAAPSNLTVRADMPTAVPRGHNWMFDDFFPRTLAVPRGSTVNFQLLGFHTATLLPQSVTAAFDNRSRGIIGPDTDDTTPNPNGTTHTVARGLVRRPASCGTPSKACVFNGTSIVTTGPFFGRSGPFAVKLTAPPGTYVFHCRVHPAMNASVLVLPAGRTGTTPSQLNAAVAAQIRTDVRSGLATERAFNHVSGIRNANGTTTWRMWAGADTRSGHVAVNEFLPRNVPIKVGDLVRWIVSGRSEPHTVTFPTVLHTDLIALCEDGTKDRPATPVHDPPRDPTDFTCGGGSPPDEIEFGGGNGRHNVTSRTVNADSGVMMNAAFGVPLGVPPAARIDRYTMRFTGTPGTYTYVCQIHPGMEGTIRVQR